MELLHGGSTKKNKRSISPVAYIVQTVAPMFHRYPSCPRVSRILKSEMIDTSPTLVAPSSLTECAVDTVGSQAGTDHKHQAPEPKPSPPTNGPRAAPTDNYLNEHNHHDIFTNVKHNTRRRRGTNGGRGGNQHVR